MIPARLGASRLPRKPLRLLGGQPLVVRVWQRVEAMQIAHRCLVATDAAEVADAVRRAGAECVLTSARHASGTDRVAEVAARAEFAQFDTIVNIQGDEPFVAEAAVRGATALVDGGRFALGTASSPATADVLDRPDVVKVIAAETGQALYFSRAGIPYLRDTSMAALRDRWIRQHIGVYAYSRVALARWVALPPHPLEEIERLEQLRPLAAGLPMGVAEIDEAPVGGIDTEEDLERANARWGDFFVGQS